jgi:DNA-binding NtrC family response regulator
MALDCSSSDTADVLSFETWVAPGVLGRSEVMRAMGELIGQLAPHFTTVLVSGETGTGKELVGRALHHLSPRRDRPFVAVNCSAIVETLFESELFGHVRGAFTGATEHRIGLFERAHGGVLLLDEVGELPHALQSKLLRVLESGEITRVGSSETRRVDVRVIAATNRPLASEVAAGRFRPDLLYRLNVVEIGVPPLRDRVEDIPLLARHFLRRYARMFDRRLDGLAPAADAALAAWLWPGNVRELRNVIERAAMLATTPTIDVDGLRLGTPQPAMPATVSTVRPIVELDRAEVVRALAETAGNKKEAARRLGISRRALYRRIEKYGLSPVRPAAA